MRSTFVVSLFASAALVVGCSSSSGPVTTCGAGTQPVEGRCETIVTCGNGTRLENNVCQPEGAACGDGTEAVEGFCVPSDGACNVGTTLVDGVCEPDFGIVCGSGTAMNDDNECEVDVELSCGPGTVEVLETDDSTKTTFGTCELACTDGQIFDEVFETCVDQCQDGSVYNPATNTCSAQCADDEYYFSDIDDCVNVPECLRNGFDTTEGDCIGWPWHELSLDTLCPRAAFYTCDAIFDPACGCDSAGNSFVRGGLGSTRDDGGANGFEDIVPTDFTLCIMEELFLCEALLQIPEMRGVVAEGEAEPDTDGIQAFDDYFSLEPGACTRPSTQGSFHQLVDAPLPPTELFDLAANLTNGLVPTDDPCLTNFSCEDGDECRRAPVEEAGFTLEDRICSPLAATDQPCGNVDNGGQVNCFSPDDRCTPEDGGSVCRRLAANGNQCNTSDDCLGDQLCFPANLHLVIDPPTDEEGNPIPQFFEDNTCQDPLLPNYPFDTAGRACIANRNESVTDGNRSFSTNVDLCAPDLQCNDGAFDEGGDGELIDGRGRCNNATGNGAFCDFCQDRADPRFSICAGDLLCSLTPVADALEEACNANVSVCGFTLQDIDLLGGFCNPFEFECDDLEDNDGDGDFDCDDEDCAEDEACIEV